MQKMVSNFRIYAKIVQEMANKAKNSSARLKLFLRQIVFAFSPLTDHLLWPQTATNITEEDSIQKSGETNSTNDL